MRIPTFLLKFLAFLIWFLLSTIGFVFERTIRRTIDPGHKLGHQMLSNVYFFVTFDYLSNQLKHTLRWGSYINIGQVPSLMLDKSGVSIAYRSSRDNLDQETLIPIRINSLGLKIILTYRVYDKDRKKVITLFCIKIRFNHYLHRRSCYRDLGDPGPP